MSLSLSESITSMQKILDNARDEITSLESGKKSSSTRARAHLQKIKNSSHELRKSITAHTKSLPVKKRSPKVAPITSDPEPDPEPASETMPEPTLEAPIKKKRVRKANKTKN